VFFLDSQTQPTTHAEYPHTPTDGHALQYTRCAKMNVLSQGLRKLSSDRSYAWLLPVTWQRWRSHHLIRHNRKPHATRKPPDAVFYRIGVICDRSLHCGNRNFDCFTIVPLTWTRGPSYRNCTRTPCRYTVCANIKFLCQGFRKLSSDRHTDIQTS